ncbi:MAG: glycerol dehydrogenase [Clostridia bacterium]|nr:glycerol dehydrogenase [Clostridia bacterium]
MSNILISPGKYVQGSGEFKKINSYAELLGKNALVLMSPSGRKRIGSLIESGFASSETELRFFDFEGECSQRQIDLVVNTIRSQGCDVIIGVGGGKTLDTTKAAAFYAKIPVIICPSIASTDAPCSALAVLYSDEGVFERYLFFPSNPNVVVIDTDVVSASPLRLTISGMGDALATFFEARACKRKNAITTAGGLCTQAAYALATLCYNTLLEEGLKAKLALNAGVCTKSVEHIIEANTLLSGLGFESCGLAAAHAIHNGLTVLEECHSMYHGEKVAFGTITQLILENADKAELEQVIRFCIALGLPVSLSELGIKKITKEKMMAVATTACKDGETIYNMPMEINPDIVYAAILAADSIGRYYLDRPVK